MNTEANHKIKMIELVIVGSITEDIIKLPNQPERRFIGGVPVYAASTAKALGRAIGIVSKVGTDFQLKNLKVLHSLAADLTGFKISGSASMVFENNYSEKGKRTQRVLSVSDQITFRDIPEDYFQSSCIHLGPVFNEISPALIPEVRNTFKVVSLDGQGFTRSTTGVNKKVVHKSWINYRKYLPYLDVLKVDDTELKGITGASTLNEAIKLTLNTGISLLVVTMAHKGAIIYHQKERYNIPAIPTTIVDETGAGDTFITAFLLEYLRTNDCYFSGLIAASAASHKIASSGPTPNYSRVEIISKLKQFIPNFQEK